MRILVFSDSHLTARFEERKYKFLKHIIERADRVIINGDFWEGYLNTFDEFVNSGWNKLFPLLKEKHAVYIFGNHDRQDLSDERTALFSDIQTHRFVLTIGDKSFIFEHGHRYVPLGSNSPDYAPSKVWMRGMDRIERFVVRRFNKRIIKASIGFLNSRIKKLRKAEVRHNEIFFCGHTHWAEVDDNAGFINSGIVKHGLGQYLWIDDGRIVTKEEWYE